MAELTFRKVGGSVMATFPGIALDFLGVKPGDTAEYFIEKDKIVIRPIKQKRHIRRYSLQKLIKEQKEIQNELNKDMDWIHESPRGKELL